MAGRRARAEKRWQKSCLGSIKKEKALKGENMVVFFDIETTNLNPYKGKVVLIGMRKDGRIRQLRVWESIRPWKGDEAKMIKWAVKIFMTISRSETIVGYNNLKFDVPFMAERLRILRQWHPSFYEVLYSRKWFDLYQFLGNNYRSFKSWLSRAGIEREFPELEGRDMPDYFELGEYEKIVQHNIDDLNSLEKLSGFLKTRPQIRILLPTNF